MIRELSELGLKVFKHHIALKKETFSNDVVIEEDGSFIKIESFEERETITERIAAKKGKSRLLLDKIEEVLGYPEKDKNAIKKNKLFIDKLYEYNHIKELYPVLSFYIENKENGILKALSYLSGEIDKEFKKSIEKGNIAFRLHNDDHRIHEKKEIINAVIHKFENGQKRKLLKDNKTCSICGKNDFPAEGDPHGMIKRIPDGQSSGCALVSYNEDAFESYNLKRNENSSICTNCATFYVEGLNWLMTNGTTQLVENKKGKQKKIFKHTNRKNFGSDDTAMIFWTRENQKLDELDILEQPTEGKVKILIDSVASGDHKISNNFETDYFYSCTLSGAAARIAIRDWIEASLSDFKQAIAQWFMDIRIDHFDFNNKKSNIQYPRLYDLARVCQNENENKKTILSRVANHLWSSAIKGGAPPIWILTSVLKRIRVEGKGVTPVHASLIRLLLNRNYKGGFMIQEKLDHDNKSTAYNSGRVFAVLESIQYAALGKTNAGLRERFFSSASSTPASAFGRILKNSQNHLTKLKGEKPGLAVILDKELTGLIARIDVLPPIFTLEEQGQFAIGYYHQKNHQFNKPELKEIVESEEK